MEIKLENKQVVIKDWGWEEIFADNNGMYRGKVLFINKGKGFHLQRHKHKDETLYVAKGEGILKFNDDVIEIKQGDSFRFKPGDVHKVIAIKDLMIFEVANTISDDDVEHLE
jgi:mannose-6-phosphate isomerase-like protein (cupin superfamily)